MNPGLYTARRLATPTPPPVPSELVLWLDASDAATVTITGGMVTSWADKSGLGNDADQTEHSPFSGNPFLWPDFDPAAINGKPAIVTRGGVDSGGRASLTAIGRTDIAPDHWLTSDNDWTFSAVVKWNATGGAVFAPGFSGTNVSSYALGTLTQGGVQEFVAGGSSLFRAPYTDSAVDYTNTPVVFTARQTAGVIQAFINGVERPITNFTDPFAYGGSYCIGMTSDDGVGISTSTGEIIFYKRSLSDVELAAAVAFLSSKWGIV